MITTITRPDEGEIRYMGNPLQETDAAGMGYMPEERGLYKKMSVMDQLLFFAEIKGIRPAVAKEDAMKWLKRLEMESWAGKKLEELSKGMAQKVQFLCTIIHNPNLIILDEPFSGFDPVNADLIKDLILELNKNGATILFSTHRMDNVEELCDRICIINHGEVKLEGDAGTLRRSKFRNEYEAAWLIEPNLSSLTIKPENTIKTADGRWLSRFRLQSESERNNLLTQCAALPELVYFSELLPTIHQIFVDTVTKENHA